MAKASHRAPQIPEGIKADLALRGMNQTSQLGPGTPLTPYEGYSQPPRVMDYPTGVNISMRSRQSWDRVSFDTLKAIIDAYDVARMCINHKTDEIRSMEPMFIPADGYEGKDIGGAIDAARAALEFPDRELPYDEWISKLMENALRYDAAPFYRRRNLGGDVIGLEVLDGPTIAPYIDDHGRRPAAPSPAYFQVIKGQVWNWYTAQDIDYRRFRPQTDSPYGLAPMESILLTANTDLRFQWHFLQMFTDGSVPAGFMELPPDVSKPDQVAEWQDYWDAIVQGDQAKLHQLVAVPNGSKFTATMPQKFDKDFPQYLMSRTCAAYGVTPQDIGLIDDVNRANGETQVDIQFRVNTLPWVRWVQGILTRYLRYDIGLPVQVKLDTGRDKEDRLEEANAWKIATDGGAVSVDEWRREVYGLPIDDERPVPRFVQGKSGPIPIMNLLAISGPTDAETGAPVDDVPLSLAPYVGPDGVEPDKPTGGTQYKRAAIDPDEPEFPALEHPIPGSDVIGTKPGTPVIGDPGAPTAAKEDAEIAAVAKEATVGVTAATGIVGSPLADVEVIEDPSEYDADGNLLVDGGLTIEVAKTAELASFRRFVKARRSAGKWRDFQFTALTPGDAYRLNTSARAEIRKDAGELIAAGLCVVATDSGRVLMMQRGMDPDDPAAGMWEFPGGHIDDGESPFGAACREWQEEVGCLLPTDIIVNSSTDLRSWLGSNGLYQGFVLAVPDESYVNMRERGQVTNPDDPDGDIVEAIAWWDPTTLPGNPNIRSELAVDAANVLAVAGAPFVVNDAVAKAGDAGPKAPAGDPRWLQHPIRHVEEQLVQHHAATIRTALATSVTDAQLHALTAAFLAAQPVAKSVATPDENAAGRAYVNSNLTLDLGDVKDAVTGALQDAYATGSLAAAQQLGAAAVAGGVDVPTDAAGWAAFWDAWTPGNAAAAGNLADGGLAAMLSDVEASIGGIGGTTLDRLGNLLAEGAANGDSVDTIAGSLSDYVSDPDRATTIANTEINRAVSTASNTQYEAQGVSQVELLVSPDACDECQDIADAGPADLGDIDCPVHPDCRCSLSPVISDNTGGDEAEAAEDESDADGAEAEAEAEA